MDEQTSTPVATAPSPKNKTNLLLGIVIVLLVAVLAVGGMLLLRSRQAASQLADAGNLVVDEDNLEDVMNRLRENVEENMFEVAMTFSWRFPDGASPASSAYVENSTANSRPFYFEVLLDDTNEVVYKSTVVPVGKALRSITLSKDLDAGVYGATCLYHFLDENNNEVSNVAFGITLTIDS